MNRSKKKTNQQTCDEVSVIMTLDRDSKSNWLGVDHSFKEQDIMLSPALQNS